MSDLSMLLCAVLHVRFIDVTLMPRRFWAPAFYNGLSINVTNVSLQMAEQLMTLAYDNGINLFDTAEVYAAGK